MGNALKVVDPGEIPVAPARPRGRPAEELARACVALRTLGIRDREMYSLLFRKTLEENPDFFGVWSVWEPDALDGQDERFRNAPGHDQSGRFVPFWNRSGSEVRLDPVTGYEYPGPGNWYWVSTSQKQLCVMDPYMYPVAGKRLLLTSQIAPVVMDGQCLGITGVDISVEWFVEHTMKGKAGASLPETNLYEELMERGLVFLNKRGEVRYWTQKTRELLARYLPEPERLLPREVLKAVNASTGAGRCRFISGTVTPSWPSRSSRSAPRRSWSRRKHPIPRAIAPALSPHGNARCITGSRKESQTSRSRRSSASACTR